MRAYGRLLRKHLGGPLLAASVVLVVSTVGYVVLAGLGWFDAVYMTFITVGAVGFSELGEFDATARAWTIVVIVTGYAVLVVMAARLTAMLLSGAWTDVAAERRRMRLMASLDGHIVVVGYGRVGEATTESFLRTGRTCAVVESDPAKARPIEGAGAVPVIGDARDAEVLLAAGIERATAVVGALSDIDNLVMVSSVRALRPDIRV
ncbi:MAG: potassium channel family protein, partial [Ilumatobacteraceae bacterium]